MVLPLLGLLLVLASNAPAGAGAPVAAPSAPPEKGVGFVRGTLGANCSDMNSLGTSWFYNWKPQDPCPPAQPGFVPMIWSQDFVSDIPKLVGKNYSALLGESRLHVAGTWPALAKDSCGQASTSPTTRGSPT